MKTLIALLVMASHAQAETSYFCYTPRDWIKFNGDINLTITEHDDELDVVVTDTQRLEVMRCKTAQAVIIKCVDTHTVTYNRETRTYYRTYRRDGKVLFMEFGTCRRIN